MADAGKKRNRVARKDSGRLEKKQKLVGMEGEWEEGLLGILEEFLRGAEKFAGVHPLGWRPFDVYAATAGREMTCYKEIVQYLVRYCSGEVVKVRVVFKWVCEGCQGMSSELARVFKTMLKIAGVESRVVHGLVKLPDGKLKHHTWTLVRVSGVWNWYDPAHDWFDVPAEVFALTHYSSDSPHPGVDSMETFESLPTNLSLKNYMSGLIPSLRATLFSSLLVTAKTGLPVPFPTYCIPPHVCSVLSAPLDITPNTPNYFQLKMHATTRKISVGPTPGTCLLTSTPDGMWEGTYTPPPSVDPAVVKVFYSTEQAVWHPLLEY